MAWEWSHTAEAYQAAEQRLRRMSRKRIREILAEWWTAAVCQHGFDMSVYRREYVRTKQFGTQVMCDVIWDRASRQRTCTNGGHRAWLCPAGCDGHQVSFDDYNPRKEPTP